MTTAYINETQSLSQGRLLQLPRELRDEIYRIHFSSTRLAFGKRPTGRIGSLQIRPARHSLALLRTCRQIHVEASPLWIGRVLFSFEEPEAMLNKLHGLPAQKLQAIRYMRVCGGPLVLSFPGLYHDVFFRLVWALKLLPGLQLERLTVLAGHVMDVAYETLTGLIVDGNGWRELWFVAPSMKVLVHHLAIDDERYKRMPQPKTWQRQLAERDGPEMGPRVAVYRARYNKTESSVLKPAMREAIQTQRPTDVLTESDRIKEALVVVTRGRGVNYTERVERPFSEDDIRNWTDLEDWPEIRRAHVDRPEDDLSDEDYGDLDSDEEEEEEDGFVVDDDDDSCSGMGMEDVPFEYDQYNDVNEYEWTPLHNEEWQ